MDSFVMRAVRGLFSLASALAALGAVAASAGALAQSLADPTQPPAMLAAPGAVAAPDPAEPAALQLQSILVSREAGGRRVAVINGEIVRAGSKVGDAVVVSVGEHAVVVRRGNSKQTLRLFPAAAGKVAGQ